MRNIIISKLNVEIFKIIIKNDEKYTYSHLQIITIKKIIFVFNKLLLHPKLIHYTFWKLNFFLSHSKSISEFLILTNYDKWRKSIQITNVQLYVQITILVKTDRIQENENTRSNDIPNKSPYLLNK